MSSQPRRRPWAGQVRHVAVRRGMAVSVVALLVGTLMGALTATGAQAHAALKSISPADGAQLGKAPTQVVLMFDEPVSTSFAVVAVTDATGRSVVAGRPQVDGATVTQALQGDLKSGNYTVAYRVVSDDGHPVSDKTTFSLSLPASESSGSSASQPSVPTTGPTGSAASGSARRTESGSDGGDLLWLWVVLAIVVVAAVGGTALTLARRRPRGP